MKHTKVVCPDCGEEISSCNFSKHERRHKNHPETFEVKQSFKLTHDGLDCQFCGKTCKNRNSLCNHERLCKDNPKRQLTRYEKYGPLEKFNKQGSTAWNKGLTKDTDERVRKHSQSLHLAYSSGRLTPSATGRTPSKETISKMLATRAHSHRKTRYKYGVYNGIYCDSSWELAFVLFCELHSVQINRCSESFEYVAENKQHLYTPDFIVNGVYYEIKGQDLFYTTEKLEQFPKDKQLILLREPEMRPILKEITSVYGNNFCIMYDRNFPSYMDFT